MTATATARKGSSTTASLKITRTDLLAAVQAVGKAVPSRPAKPILQNVRIGDGLVTGTDIEVRIDVQIGEVCDAFLVPHGRLLSILRAATGDDVTLTAKGSAVTVKCGRGKWELPTEDAAEFPSWESSELQPVCRLPADQFRRAARATSYATDNESSRFALGAVLVEVAGGNPTWVATDGRRLSCVETETDQAVDDQKVLVPSRLLDIASGMAVGDGSVQLEASDKEVRFTLSTATVTGLRCAGSFPRWRDVVGDINGTPTVLEVAGLLSAVRAAAIVTSEQSKGVDLTWTADTLVLSGKSSEYGESIVKCPLVAAGSTSPTKLDPGFLSEFLSHIPADEQPHVDVYVADEQSRVLLKCGDYVGVIMPLAKE